MPNFQTHISTSAALGLAYAGWGQMSLDMPVSTSILAGGMCTVAGMLPDVDSDSSVPLREVLVFLASVSPMLMMRHFVRWGLTPESMVLASAFLYVVVRFGIGEVLRRYTVHRGMWHSLPAAAIAGLTAALICSYDAIDPRMFKAGGVFLGYLSHLVLDELHGYRLLGRGRMRNSLGSALKLWRHDVWANVSTYVKLLALLAWTTSDPALMQRYGLQDTTVHRVTRDAFDRVLAGLRFERQPDDRPSNPIVIGQPDPFLSIPTERPRDPFSSDHWPPPGE